MSDTETPRRAALADFQAQTYLFEIVAPTGEDLLVEMRALTPADILQINRALPPVPKPPEKDFRKDDDGRLQLIYDTADPGYLQALEDRRVQLMNRAILRAWVVDLPGETEDERLAALDTLAAWARAGLWQAVNRLMVLGDEGVRLHPFRPA